MARAAFWTAYQTRSADRVDARRAPIHRRDRDHLPRRGVRALRAGASNARETAVIDTIFSISSILAPFAIGGIATDRVPIGNATGHLLSSWLNPTSVFIGLLAVTSCAYLAAAYLAADRPARSPGT